MAPTGRAVCISCWSVMARRERGQGSRIVAGPDDEALFRETLKDVEPLKKRPARVAPDIRRSLPPAKVPGAVKGPPRPHPSLPPAPAAKAKLPPLHLGGVAGIDRRTAERLRRGRLPVEARLDLHGRTQDEAHRELIAFIRRTAAAGLRCVLIVTGKGAVSQGGGVLRRRLPDWLAQADCRPHILSVTRAQRKHGGEGAFYVLLRRQRGENRRG